MPVADPHHAVLRHRWAAEAAALERRRQRLVAAAQEAARALRHCWPSVEAIWLFGSAAGPLGFRRHSDLDLALAGLPAEAQIPALALVEQLVDPALAAAGEAGIAIDLVRLDDLDPHWQARIRQRGLVLWAPPLP
jgi:predicted nucleotidyltransferase